MVDVCEEEAAQGSFEMIGFEHHLAHIASAYYLSPLDEVTAGFSCSGA
jgi:carbamoyltransferase